MKRTVACVAMIAAATSIANAKEEKRDTASARMDGPSWQGMTFVGCKPAYPLFKDKDAYKNNCVTALQTVEVPGGFAPRTNQACAEGYHVVVSSTPVNTSCLPPGVVEL